jgi:hypothetical protein
MGKNPNYLGNFNIYIFDLNPAMNSLDDVINSYISYEALANRLEFEEIPHPIQINPKGAQEITQKSYEFKSDPSVVGFFEGIMVTAAFVDGSQGYLVVERVATEYWEELASDFDVINGNLEVGRNTS